MRAYGLIVAVTASATAAITVTAASATAAIMVTATAAAVPQCIIVSLPVSLAEAFAEGIPAAASVVITTSLICLYYKIWDRGTMCADNGEKTECGKGQWYTGKDGNGCNSI